MDRASLRVEAGGREATVEVGVLPYGCRARVDAVLHGAGASPGGSAHVRLGGYWWMSKDYKYLTEVCTKDILSSRQKVL